MNSAQNSERTREQKEEFAKKRMDEMRLKNEKIMQRHAEVENDRRKAEEENSAVTNTAKVVLKKEESLYTCELPSRIETKVEHAREWDEGKRDREHWQSLDHHSSFKNYRTSHHDRNADRRRDSRNNSSRNDGIDHYKYNCGTEGMRNNRKMKGYNSYNQQICETDQQYTSSNSSHLYKSPKRSRGMGYRSGDSFRKSHSCYSEDKYKTPNYNRSYSRKKYTECTRSSNASSDSENISNLRLVKDSLWQSDKIREDENKQTRVETWLKTVNKNNMWVDENYAAEEKNKSSVKSYSKFDRFERSSDQSSNDEAFLASNVSIPQRESKSQGNGSYSPRKDAAENKFGNKGGFHQKPMPDTSTQNGNSQRGRNKRSPQYGSTGNGKNEMFRKQRKFDSKDFKSSENKNIFVKSKIVKASSFNNAWNDVEPDNYNSKSYKYNSNNQDKCMPNEDGLWENARQSDLKWELSDDESNLQRTHNQNVKYDGWQTENASNSNVVKQKFRTNDGWGNQNMGNSNAGKRNVSADGWNDEAITVKNKDRIDDGWEDCGDETHTVDPRNDKNWLSEDIEVTHVKLSNNTLKVKITGFQQHLNSSLQKSFANDVDITNTAEKIISPFKHSVRVSDGHDNSDFTSNVHSEKSLNASDDGGWSTVSEEGEIHSEDDKVHDVIRKGKICNTGSSVVK